MEPLNKEMLNDYFSFYKYVKDNFCFLKFDEYWNTDIYISKRDVYNKYSKEYIMRNWISNFKSNNNKSNNMEKRKIMYTEGDANGSIDDLITWLEECKSKGGTHYKMTWSNDPMWAFKWFEVYRTVSDEELKQEKIYELKKKLKELEG